MEEWVSRKLTWRLKYMARSYRKNVYGSWCSSRSMKEWRTQENRRLRHNAKQLINTCEDYDGLIVPVLDDYDSLWRSPQDGRKHPIKVPLLNECEVERSKIFHSRGSERLEWHDKYYKFDGSHYTKSCSCYGNKKSFYWKAKRQ